MVCFAWDNIKKIVESPIDIVSFSLPFFVEKTFCICTHARYTLTGNRSLILQILRFDLCGNNMYSLSTPIIISST